MKMREAQKIMPNDMASEKTPRLYFKSLREQVYDYLREELYAGRVLPNSSLNLKALSTHLGVSITPLRDALLRMDQEGFVTILPRKGVIVNSLTLQDVKTSIKSSVRWRVRSSNRFSSC